MIRSVGSWMYEHFFSVSILLFLVLLAGSSYVHFVLERDYLVTYEGDCDPYTESCFEGCEDDDCTEVYYYSVIERHAAEVYNLCGQGNVLECDEAWECPAEAGECSITYCSPEEDGEDVCISLTEEEV